MRCRDTLSRRLILIMGKTEKTTDRRKQIKGKLKDALDLMIFGGDDRVALAWSDAARTVNFSPQAMRKALQKAHVQRYLRDQRQVLLAAISGQNPSRLAALRDQDSNPAAAVRAAMALETIGAVEETRTRHTSTPGFVVFIGTPPPGALAPPTVDVHAVPLIEHQAEPELIERDA